MLSSDFFQGKVGKKMFPDKEFRTHACSEYSKTVTRARISSVGAELQKYFKLREIQFTKTPAKKNVQCR